MEQMKSVERVQILAMSIRPCEGVRRSISLMSSSLILQQCPTTCLVSLTLIVFVMGGRWPYSYYFVIYRNRMDIFVVTLKHLNKQTKQSRLN